MKKTAMFIFAIALCSASLRAQKPKSAEYTGPAHKIELDSPATLTKIYSTLGPASNAYVTQGTLVSGPLSSLGTTQYVAMSFRPKQDAHVSQLRAAIQYDGSGANQVRLSLYSDVSGAPGVLLAGPITVTNLPAFFSCCRTANANIPSTAVTAGSRYWVVADTVSAGTGSDFLGVWAWVPPAKSLIGIDMGGGWVSFGPTIEEPAGAVLGSIP